MRQRPKRNLDEEQQRAAEQFIDAAEESPRAPESGGEEDPYPWERPGVRADVKQTYPLRLPEPLHLKLKFVSEETGRSMNELCNEAVEDLVEEHLAEISGEE